MAKYTVAVSYSREMEIFASVDSGVAVGEASFLHFIGTLGSLYF